ncbi:MAG: hypothetical protein QF515_16280 [Pseudomonadales bacterium]|nr:hypothetical protein [Pseudomonadales bacterium]MDP6828650.1 hypothetical protein [Pseudomonadales bacterium]
MENIYRVLVEFLVNYSFQILGALMVLAAGFLGGDGYRGGCCVYRNGATST